MSRLLADPFNRALLEAYVDLEQHSTEAGQSSTDQGQPARERAQHIPMLDVAPGVRISATPLSAEEAAQFLGRGGSTITFGGLLGGLSEQLLQAGSSGPLECQLDAESMPAGQAAGGSGAEAAAAQSGSGAQRESGAQLPAASAGAAPGGNAAGSRATEAATSTGAAGNSSGADVAASAAAAKRCAVCGTAAEPGRKLKRCGGCHKVGWLPTGLVAAQPVLPAMHGM